MIEMEVAGKTFKANELVDILVPYVTEHRWERVQQVIAQRTHHIAPVLENIYDRGNTSAVMRSAEAFGFTNFNIVELPDAKFKAANRVTMGTDKWLDIKKHDSSKVCVDKLKSQGFKVYCTHLNATTKIENIDFTQKTAVVFGNEKDGVTEEIVDASDGTFIIPMAGFAQSFNISVAAAICFYHIYQYRNQKLGQSGDLTNEETLALQAEYLLKSIPSAEKILSRS